MIAEKGEVNFVLTVQRKNGSVETIPMVGRVIPDQSTQETSNVSDTLDGCTQRGD